jgi:hypothetical protein
MVETGMTSLRPLPGYTWFDRKSGGCGHEDLAKQSPASKEMSTGAEESTF